MALPLLMVPQLHILRHTSHVTHHRHAVTMIFEISNKYLPGYVLEVDLAKFTGLFTGKKEEAPTGEFSAHKATPSVEAASEVRVETTKEGSAGHVLEGWSSG